jgi:hypothetical protein
MSSMSPSMAGLDVVEAELSSLKCLKPDYIYYYLSRPLSTTVSVVPGTVTCVVASTAFGVEHTSPQLKSDLYSVVLFTWTEMLNR